LDASGIGAGGGFGKAEGTEDFAGSESAEIAGFLVVGGESEDGKLHGGIGDAESGGDRGVNAGHFFQHEDVGDGVECGAAPVVGHEHAATTEISESADGVEGKVVGALPVFDVRTDFGGHEVADGVTDEELVVGEGEVHREESLAWVMRADGYQRSGIGDQKTGGSAQRAQRKAEKGREKSGTTPSIRKSFKAMPHCEPAKGADDAVG
jgi:hypothetical protein